jgi:hypothetical protein
MSSMERFHLLAYNCAGKAQPDLPETVGLDSEQIVVCSDTGAILLR